MKKFAFRANSTAEMMRRKREEIREESNRLTNSLTSPIVDGGIESKYAGFQSKTHAS